MITHPYIKDMRNIKFEKQQIEKIWTKSIYEIEKKFGANYFVDENLFYVFEKYCVLPKGSIRGG